MRLIAVYDLSNVVHDGRKFFERVNQINKIMNKFWFPQTAKEITALSSVAAIMITGYEGLRKEIFTVDSRLGGQIESSEKRQREDLSAFRKEVREDFNEVKADTRIINSKILDLKGDTGEIKGMLKILINN